MRILEINAYDFGSTGKIMLGIANIAREHGYEVFTCSSTIKGSRTSSNNHFYIDKPSSTKIHKFFGLLFGEEFRFSNKGTNNLINFIKRVKPDIIHIHNIHGYFLNIGQLFDFFKTLDCKFVWTLHDCWSFTGRCPHFGLTNCERWKTGCYDCVYNRKLYPESFFADRTKRNWKKKKDIFCGLNHLTLVTPSNWLAGLAGQSFLQQYPIKVINNGIDLSIFKPVQSNFRKDHGISKDKFILLGVAFNFNRRKGIDVFIELSKRLNEKYQVVLVGTNEEIDAILPKNIISIHRTESQRQLVEIYSASSLFVNPTREDTFPTVNMEALACGIPVVTFNTGGSPEVIDGSCGSVVERDDIASLEKEIIRICENKPYSKSACLKRAKVFDATTKFRDYLALYEELGNNHNF